MEKQNQISRKALENRKKVLLQEIEHIDYVLKISCSAINEIKYSSTKRMVIEILKNNELPMQSKDIYLRLKNHGSKLKNSSFRISIARWAKDEKTPIKQAEGYGMYKYEYKPNSELN